MLLSFLFPSHVLGDSSPKAKTHLQQIVAACYIVLPLSASFQRLNWSFGLCIKSYDLAKLPGIADFLCTAIKEPQLLYPFFRVLKNRNTFGMIEIWEGVRFWILSRTLFCAGMASFCLELSEVHYVQSWSRWQVSDQRFCALTKSSILEKCSDLLPRGQRNSMPEAWAEMCKGGDSIQWILWSIMENIKYTHRSYTLYIPWFQNASSVNVGVFQNAFWTCNAFWCIHLQLEEVCNKETAAFAPRLFLFMVTSILYLRQAKRSAAGRLMFRLSPLLSSLHVAICWTWDKFRGRAGGRLAEAKEPS